MRRRGGYTLIEVVVAVLIFTAGGLALAGGSAVIGRTMAMNARRETATRVAMSRLEQLRAGCGSATSGADRAEGVGLRWNVVTDAASVTVVATVSYLTPFGVHTETFRSSFACQ